MNSYFCETCPECDAENMVSAGDVSDQTAMDPEDFKCWKCGKTSRLPEYDGDDTDEDDEDGDYEGMEADMPNQSYESFAKTLLRLLSEEPDKRNEMIKNLKQSLEAKTDSKKYQAIQKVMKHVEET